MPEQTVPQAFSLWLDWLQQHCPELQSSQVDGNIFCFYGTERMMPFLTLVSEDSYDITGQLRQPGDYRLSIGLDKATYTHCFPELQPADLKQYNFSPYNTLMPHPVYAVQNWVCILNPEPSGWEALLPLISVAYTQAQSRAARKAVRQQQTG